MDADVIWRGRRVARFADFMVDNHHLRGRWEATGDPEFERQLSDVRSRIVPDGQAMFAITLRFPDGTDHPARAYLVRDRPHFTYRAGLVGDVDTISIPEPEPDEVKDCERCGRRIEPDLLRMLRGWPRCRGCQIEFEDQARRQAAAERGW